MPSLCVNVDHVATVRQARRATEPDPVRAAMLAEMAGADGIVIHVREDRRHAQDRDLKILRQIVETQLNLEMAATEEMVDLAQRVRPDLVTLVPEKREEVTHRLVERFGLLQVDEMARTGDDDALRAGDAGRDRPHVRVDVSHRGQRVTSPHLPSRPTLTQAGPSPGRTTEAQRPGR